MYRDLATALATRGMFMRERFVAVAFFTDPLCASQTTRENNKQKIMSRLIHTSMFYVFYEQIPEFETEEGLCVSVMLR
jgi:hypothetical protein